MISNLERGKAVDIDKHLQYNHALLPVVLSRLFNLMIYNGCVPRKFGQSCTVPILESSCNMFAESLAVDDFRGVSISPAISEVFERCISDRYDEFFRYQQ